MRKNQGITLIALIITIIVMLILVGVVVTVVIQSDLLGTAKTAGDKYKTAYEEESKMSEVTINGKQYGSIEEYMEEINPIIVEPKNIEDWIYVIEDDGTITINGYKGLDTEVVIPNYINGIPVKKIGKVLFGYGFGQGFWDPSICEQGYVDIYFYRQNTITKVVISYGIEIIDSMALNHSNALQEIVIPKTVKNIGDNVFFGCDSLKEIAIPSSVTNVGYEIARGIPTITIHVSWKKGEKPEGWNDNWAVGNVVIDYAK